MEKAHLPFHPSDSKISDLSNTDQIISPQYKGNNKIRYSINSSWTHTLVTMLGMDGTRFNWDVRRSAPSATSSPRNRKQNLNLGCVQVDARNIFRVAMARALEFLSAGIFPLAWVLQKWTVFKIELLHPWGCFTKSWIVNRGMKTGGTGTNPQQGPDPRSSFLLFQCEWFKHSLIKILSVSATE